MYTKLVALALGVALTFGAAAGDARAASDCAVTISIGGFSLDVCYETDTESNRRTERDLENANVAVGAVEVDGTGNCVAEAEASDRGEVPAGTVNISIASC